MKITRKRVEVGIFSATWDAIIDNFQLGVIGLAVGMVFSAPEAGWFAWVLLALGLVACFFRACSETARLDLEKARAELRYVQGQVSGHLRARAEQEQWEKVAELRGVRRG